MKKFSLLVSENVHDIVCIKILFQGRSFFSILVNSMSKGSSKVVPEILPGNEESSVEPKIVAENGPSNEGEELAGRRTFSSPLVTVPAINSHGAVRRSRPYPGRLSSLERRF